MNCIWFIFLIYETKNLLYIGQHCGIPNLQIRNLSEISASITQAGIFKMSTIQSIYDIILLFILDDQVRPRTATPSSSMHQASVTIIYSNLDVLDWVKIVIFLDWRMSRIPEMVIHIGYVCVNIFSVDYILQFCERRNLFCSL